MKALALVLVAALLIQGTVLAQESWRVEVPSTGYESTDTLSPDSLFKFYDVRVEAGQELSYEFAVVGNGTISVRLYFEGFQEYSVYYSSVGSVTNFSATIPPDFGFARNYHIEVNTTAPEGLTYTASVSMTEAPTEGYTLYYVLIAIGFIVLVFGSWRYVVWQDKKEKEAKARSKEKRKRGGRR